MKRRQISKTICRQVKDACALKGLIHCTDRCRECKVDLPVFKDEDMEHPDESFMRLWASDYY